jgi:chromate transporter
MKADGDLLLAVVQEFAFISLLAIGGANAVVPEMHREVVDLRHWVTDLQFTELFAISQAAPGPNVMIVALIGQFVAGPLGAVLAMAAMCDPTAVLACGVAKVFDRYRGSRWRRAVEAGLVPVTIGLVAATAWIIARTADRSLMAVILTVVSFALTHWTRINPLFALGAAAIFGFAGLL